MYYAEKQHAIHAGHRPPLILLPPQSCLHHHHHCYLHNAHQPHCFVEWESLQQRVERVTGRFNKCLGPGYLRIYNLCSMSLGTSYRQCLPGFGVETILP